ncbi:DUF1992 domain-containing protein, partial [Salmonella enterica subsp. enterica serovar Kentucky]|nr:DUF1992 domain-containing protein [Salmonella enterica subsp. enterica serovar Kentucky]
IIEAQRKGEFDNLPGRGEPLILDDDSHVPAELRAGYRLLKNADELATTESDDSSPLLDAEVSESDDAHAIGLKLQNTISNVLSET